MRTVHLLGLDFGTTTSSAVAASAALVRNTVTGRTELSNIRERFRSEKVFTPFRDDLLDEQRLAAYLQSWLTAGNMCAEEIFGGGALLTGLAARAENAADLVRLIRDRLGDALVARADDPCLESWLAFLGNCSRLSQQNPDAWIINLDIGGGTTNIAIGRGGQVVRTGCLLVGARHVQVRPGTYTIERLSSFAVKLFTALGITKATGDALSKPEVDAVVDFYARLLQEAVTGNRDVFREPIAQVHEQVPFVLLPKVREPIITLSGGVGELVYNSLGGEPLPATTQYGDLGIDLARRLLQTAWVDQCRCYRPDGGGRATVYGLVQHSTQVSGSTLFLPHPEDLPLADLPILGCVGETTSAEELESILGLARRSPRGAGVRVELARPGVEQVRAFGGRLAAALKKLDFPAHQPLVLFVPHNLGKVLGHYVTEWGALPLHLAVVDEVAVGDAHYAHLGKMYDQIVPVSVYGLKEGDTHENAHARGLDPGAGAEAGPGL